MISAIRTALACQWSARRIQRYLDADPAAPLRPDEVRRLETHLAACEGCTALAQEHRLLSRALSRLSGRGLPSPEAIARMHAVVDRLAETKGPLE